MRRTLKTLKTPTNFLLAIALVMPVITGVLFLRAEWARSAEQIREGQRQIAAIKVLQQQELATFKLLQETVERFTGPKAQAAQRKATEAFINSLIQRIVDLDNQLLDAIRSGSRVVIPKPGPTKTVCHLPNGKPC